MADDTVTHNLENMDELDFTGWNRADWEGVFARVVDGGGHLIAFARMDKAILRLVEPRC